MKRANGTDRTSANGRHAVGEAPASSEAIAIDLHRTRAAHVIAAVANRWGHPEPAELADASRSLHPADMPSPVAQAAFAFVLAERDAGAVAIPTLTIRSHLLIEGFTADEADGLCDAIQDAYTNANLCRDAEAIREAKLKLRWADRLHRLAVEAANGTPLADVLAGVRELGDSCATHGDGRPAFDFQTAAQFAAADLRRDYHVAGVLAAGPVPTVIAGAFKTLKTSITMDLIVSLATGSRFLGHFPTTPTTVAIMSGESGGYALQNMAKRIAHAKGWTLDAIGDRLRICTAVPSLSDPGQLREIERFIVEHRIGVFVIDPAYLAMRGLRSDDAGNLFSMGDFLDPAAAIGTRTNCTPVIVHHNSRGATRANVGEPAELADIAWSGFAEWAGQWLLLARRERYDPDSNGEHKLWLTAGGRDGHSTLVGVNVTEGRADDPGGRYWSVEVEAASSTRAAAIGAEQERREEERETRRTKQAEQDRETIVAIMQTIPDGDTKTAIRDRSGLRGDRFNPVFAALLAEGRIETCTVSKGNGRQYDGYRLHPDAPGRIGTHNGHKPPSRCDASETDAPPIGGVPSDCDALLSSD